jgi:WD40 repeat protein
MRFGADSRSLTIELRHPEQPVMIEELTYDTATGLERSRQRFFGGPASSAARSRDGHTVAAAGVEGRERSRVYLRAAETGALIATIDGAGPSSGEVTALEYSPDDRTLAIGRDNGTLELWNVAGTAPRRQVVLGRPSRDQKIPEIQFDGGGRWLVATRSPDTSKPPSTGERQFKRSRNWIMTGGIYMDMPEVIVWDVATHRPIARLDGQFGARISPDGKTLTTDNMDPRPDRSGPVFWDLPARP